MANQGVTANVGGVPLSCGHTYRNSTLQKVSNVSLPRDLKFQLGVNDSNLPISPSKMFGYYWLLIMPGMSNHEHSFPEHVTKIWNPSEKKKASATHSHYSDKNAEVAGNH